MRPWEWDCFFGDCGLGLGWVWGGLKMWGRWVRHFLGFLNLSGGGGGGEGGVFNGGEICFFFVLF